MRAKRDPSLMRTSGALQFARRVSNQSEFAKKIGVQQGTVSKWANGDMVPTIEFRAIIFRELEIPETDWDVYPELQAKAPANEPIRARRRPVREIAEDLESFVTSVMRRVQDDRMATPVEQAKVAATLAQSLMLLGRISGETSQMTEAAILKLPTFRRVMKDLLDALTPWPEAMKAIVDKMGEIEAPASEATDEET